MNMSKPPFFIVGCPRSGTTLFQTLVDQHPKLCIPPESFIFSYFGQYLCSGKIDFSNKAHVQLLTEHVINNNRIKSWGLPLDTSTFTNRCYSGPSEYINHLFSLYASYAGKTRWGDKTPQHALCIPEILKVYPEAKFIHVVRDGRDVAESSRRVTIGPKSMRGIATRWCHFVNTVESEFKSIPEENAIQVYYEDLILDKARVMNDVFAFLGEASIDSGISNPESSVSEKYATISSFHHSSQKGIDKSKIGIYKKRMSQNEITLFESVAAPTLARFGYQVTSSPSRFSIRQDISDLYLDKIHKILIKLMSKNGIELAKHQIVEYFQSLRRKKALSIFL